MAKQQKKKDAPVTVTLATGTKVTGPQSVIDKVKPKAEREAKANASKSK